MTRIAKKRYEATDEQRWFSPPPCRIDELAPTPLPVPESDATLKRIYDDPQLPAGARLLIDRI